MEYKVNEYLAADRMAEEILKLSRNAFLDNLSGDGLSSKDKYAPSVDSWYRIVKYRAMGDEEKTKLACEKATLNWINSSFSTEKEAVWAVIRNGDDGGCFYGASQGKSEDTFSSILSECNVEYTNPVNITTEYNGFFSGSFCGSELANTLLNSNIDEFYAACVVVPYMLSDVEKRIIELEENKAFLERFKSVQRVYGTSTRRVDDVSNERIMNAIGMLSEHLTFLKEYKNKGFARCIIKFGTRNEDDFYELHRIINSVIVSEHTNKYVEPLRAFSSFSFERTWEDHLAIPFAITDRNTGKGMHILSIQTLDSISKVCNPGFISNPYMLVKNYSINENSRSLFEGETVSCGEFELGNDSAGKPVKLENDKLCCHTAVFGSAGGGKTNTIKLLTLESYKKGIPVLVIEAAKKEYSELSADIKGIHIYTPGTNGTMLEINPLEPEDGTLIENQVDMLVRAIVAAHGNEHPIPEGFEGLLRMTYEKNGWCYGMVAYHDSNRPFPTFKDVYDNIDEYVNTYAVYGNEVKQNLVGALSIRAERMYSGALGRVFSHDNGLTAENLLSNFTVIELDDFSEGAKTFLTNVLMFKIQTYLSHQGKVKSLKRLIIIEEAHNIFRKARKNEESRDLSNDYFDKMLSEIRASGTGLVICDQRPSIISDAVIENTAIKIVHALEEKNDRDIVSASLNLTPVQNMKLRELSKGECLISVREKYGVRDVFVHEVKSKPINNHFCTMCTSCFNCHKDEINGVIATLEQDKYDDLTTKLSLNPYNGQFVKIIMESFLEREKLNLSINRRCCFLGFVLKRFSSLSDEVQRMLLCAYSNELGKE